MDFQSVQLANRRQGALFGAAFALTIVSWAVAVFLILDFAFDFALAPERQYLGFGSTPNRLGLLARHPLIPTLVLAPAALALVLGASIARVKRIADGGSSLIATSLGAVPLGLDSDLAAAPQRLRERMLANIVSEMAVASGVPEPDVYVLPDDHGINAMAAGLDEDDAAVVVTMGALRRLTRDELAAVIGHEFSHILNGDTRLFTLMGGWLHGLFAAQIHARRIALSSWGVKLFVPAVLMVATGFLGWLAGRLLQAAFCRSREWLADASSVQFTRDPKALAGALKKIGGLRRGSRVRAPAAVGLGHLFIANPGALRWLGAHPPLAERIWALDPSWDGWWHDFDLDPVDYLAGPETPAGAGPRSLPAEGPP